MAHRDSITSAVVRAFTHFPHKLFRFPSERLNPQPRSIPPQRNPFNSDCRLPVFDEPSQVIDRLWLRAGLRSVTGHYRESNEDCCYANRRDGLFVVADGVGGHHGGAVASQLLVDTISSQLVPQLRHCQSIGCDLENLIGQSIQAAHHEIAHAAACEPALSEMGSTLVLGVVAGGSLFLTHLGDSRAYLVRRGTVRQITSDHTVVQALIDAGCLTNEEADQHPLRHVISDCVSAKRPCSQVTVQKLPLQSGDRLLFTTDGLTDVLDEEWIGFTLTREEDPQAAADLLVEQALWNNSKDNISCVVVHVETMQP